MFQNLRDSCSSRESAKSSSQLSRRSSHDAVMLDTNAHASSLKKYGLHARTLERTPSSDTGGRQPRQETTVIARIHSHKSGTTETEFSSETE